MKDAQGHGSNGSGALEMRVNRFVANAPVVERHEWMGTGHPKADLAAAKELGQNRPHATPPVIHPAFGRRT